MNDFYQPKELIEKETHKHKTKKKPPKKKVVLITILVLALLIFGGFFYKAGFTFSKILVIKNIAWESIFGKLPNSNYSPPVDKDRINILLLGIRGINDKNGGLLTDSIMIVSFKKSTGQVAMISIPRDLYIEMPGKSYKAKINAAYAIGLENYQNGLDYAKKTIGYVTGLYTNFSAAVDFEAFKRVVDDIKGITIHLDEKFVEDKQWWCDEDGQNCRPFIIETGDQTLNGETALFYIRSRFSSSDFDRARRQQQVMSAIKNKLLSLGVLTNPLIINNLLETVSSHIRIDILPWEIPSLITWAQKADKDNIIRKVFDTSSNGLLKQTVLENGTYVLLPEQEDFTEIRKACQNIFEQ